MDIRQFAEHTLRNAILLHQTYNNSGTLENIENIQKLIEYLKELKTENMKIKMDYNALYFDFTNYKAIKGDDEETDDTPDAIDIYDN